MYVGLIFSCKDCSNHHCMHYIDHFCDTCHENLYNLFLLFFFFFCAFNYNSKALFTQETTDDVFAFLLPPDHPPISGPGSPPSCTRLMLNASFDRQYHLPNSPMQGSFHTYPVCFLIVSAVPFFLCVLRNFTVICIFIVFFFFGQFFCWADQKAQIAAKLR